LSCRLTFLLIYPNAAQDCKQIYLSRKAAKLAKCNFLFFLAFFASLIFSPKQIVQGIEQIIKKIIRFDSQIEIYIQSTLPTTGKYDNLNDLILEYNKYLSKISNHHSVNFINLYSHFTNIKNSLNTVFTKDGLHLNSQGYKLWKNLIPPYLN